MDLTGNDAAHGSGRVPQIWIATPFEKPDARLADAALKAGAFPVLHLGRVRAEAVAAMELLSRLGGRYGVCIAEGVGWDADLPQQVCVVVLPWGEEPPKAAGRPGIEIVWQVRSAAEAHEAIENKAKSMILKSAEGAGGCGEDSSFILFQKTISACLAAGVGLYVQGGVGVHTAAAYIALGAAGVVLDSQAALFPECSCPRSLKNALRKLSGSEIRSFGGYRCYAPPGQTGVEGAEGYFIKVPGADDLGADDLGSEGTPGTGVRAIPLGQDIILAPDLADEYKKLKYLVKALKNAPFAHVAISSRQDCFAKSGSAAKNAGSDYPIAQGPMARISDTPGFLGSVATGGGLPFLAMGAMAGEAAENALRGAADAMGGRAWGAGILGFGRPKTLEEQTRLIIDAKPAFVLIAGGRPAQAKVFEKAGIKVLLHAPTPGLLDMFLKEGARAFVFEGRESGGHVGPLHSALLWEKQINRMLKCDNFPELSAFFAGGVHDALSAAFVRIAAGPLAARGVKVSLLCGTAYLYTEEAVASGAITGQYQKLLIDRGETVLLKSGGGQETRCIPTPFADFFAQEKARMEKEGLEPGRVIVELESTNLGRLRVASKGLERDGGVLKPVPDDEQYEKGLYMTGAVTELSGRATTIAQLHEALTAGSFELLSGLPALAQPGGRGSTVVQSTVGRGSDVLSAGQDTPNAPPVGRGFPDAPTLPVGRVSPDLTSPVGRGFKNAPLANASMKGAAVVGMAGIFPQAADLDEFWRNIVFGRDCITAVPSERWSADLFYDPEAKDSDHVPSYRGGFISKTAFDALEFGITPQSLSAIEPVQLLSLLVAKRALEDAGFGDLSQEDFDDTTVIFGAEGAGELATSYGFRIGIRQMLGELPEEASEILPRLTEDSFPGVLGNVIAGRISNRLNTGGRNFTVDAACASSLAALDIAMAELDSRKAGMVILGGADMHNGIYDYLMFSSTHALSRKGRCATFDAEADGIVLGEGIGVVILKRLEDAVRDGNKIYAVIKGVGGSSDGKSLGLTAPSKFGQMRALERAYEDAGVRPSDVGLIESHGTGTVVGDQIELSALTDVFFYDGAAPGGTALGSVKSQIGHTKCAAGIAGLIKAVNCVRHGVLPPTLHLNKPNGVYFKDGPFSFRTGHAGYWGASRRVAGVSGFGFGGTNYHAVVENYEPGRPRATLKAWPSELFVFAGETAKEAEALMEKVAEAIAANGALRPRDIAYTLSRKGGTAQYAVVAGTPAELAARMECARGGIEDENVFPLKPAPGKVAFLFPGQGSQRVDMAADLFTAFPRMRRLLDNAPEYGRILFPNAVFSDAEKKSLRNEITDTRNAQPLLGIVDMAIAELLLEFGVKPDMAAGHSYGELAALCFAGAFDAGSLVDLSRARAEAILAAAGGDPGRMAAVLADAGAAAGLLEGLEGVWAVNFNSPRQTVAAGTDAGIGALLKKAEESGVACREVNVACAFHSPLLEGADKLFSAALERVGFYKPGMPVRSNMNAGVYPDSADEIKKMLAAHLVNPVRFADEINGMIGDGAAVFIEAGPGGALTRLVSEIADGGGAVLIQTERNGADGLTYFLKGLAKFIATGRGIDMERLFVDRDAEELDFDEPLNNKKGGIIWNVDGLAAIPENGELPPHAGKPGHGPIMLSGGLQKAPPAPTADHVMMSYLDNMNAMIMQQRDVMLGYLGAPEAAPRAAAPARRAAFDVLPARQGFEAAAGGGVSYGQAEQPEAMLVQQAGGGSGGIGYGTDANAGPGGGFGAGSGAGPEPGSNPGADLPEVSSLSKEQITAIVFDIVSEKTGYPVSMLNPDLDLEADLSIDSIKKMEIVAELRNRIKIAENEDGMDAFFEKMISISKFRDLTEWLWEIGQSGAAANAAAGTDVTAGIKAAAGTDAAADRGEDAGGGAITSDGAGVGSGGVTGGESGGFAGATLAAGADVIEPMPGTKATRIVRLIPVEAPWPVTGRDMSVLAKKTFAVTDDGNGLSASVAAALGGAGASASVLTLGSNEAETAALLGGVDGLVLINSSAGRRRYSVADLFDLLKLADMDRLQWLLVLDDAAGAALEGGAGAPLEGGVGAPLEGGVGAPHNCGAFGSQGGLPAQLPQGFPGFVKTLCHEYPGKALRVAQFETIFNEGNFADIVMDELASGGADPHVFYRGVSRFVFIPKPTAINDGNMGHPRMGLDKDAVVVVLGGAQGIASRIVERLAKDYPCNYVLIGRSPEDPAYEQYAKFSSVDEIRKHLIEHEGMSQPKDIEAKSKAAFKSSRISLAKAGIENEGGKAEYISADAADAGAFGEALNRIARSHGRIDGVIHAAGIIEDKFFRHKTADSFRRVYETKTAPLSTILGVLPELKFLILFSSVSAAAGSAGQCDYAAGNSALDSAARILKRIKPELKVASIGWGPWKGAGMVSDGVESQMRKKGVSLIGLEEGAEFFANELAYGDQPYALAIAGDGASETDETSATDETSETDVPSVVDFVEKLFRGEHERP